MNADTVALFRELADRSAAERQAYYVERRISAELRAEVESLLSFDAAAGDSLGEHVAAAAERALRETAVVPAGSRYGSYRLVRLLGGGGMGAVYEAEQDSPRRIVALKVIRTGLASPDLARRFIQEARALGRLQHPGIAQIYEAGTADTPLGPQPFFAMELVRGEPLLQYADSHRIGTRQRLELTTRICEAVHHAHQRGIIHRDLKPGNILVEETGQPKILDFGVSRITDGDAPSAGETDAGQLVGTLAYMSPEQVVADPLEIDTRSDVYALGVILYELLAGRLPYNTTGKLHDVVHAIRAEDAPLLGTIDRAYRGDIETIVAKAMEKEKARRYGSVTALAEDIQRHLADEPIAARRPTRAYQLRKFVRRNTAMVAGAAAVFVVLVAGVIISSWQAARALRAEKAAAQEAATASAINDFLQHDLLAQASSFTQAKPGTRPDPDLKVRTALDRAAATIAGKFEKQPLIEASLRNTIAMTYRDLALYPDAERQLQQAIVLQRRVLGDNHPDTLTTMSRLAELHVTQSKYAEAESLAVKVLDARRRIFGEDHPETLASMATLADMYRLTRQTAKAEPLLGRIIQTLRRVKGEADLETLENRDVRAVVYRQQGRFAEAERELQEILSIRRRVQGDDHPDTLTTINSLVVLYDAMGRYSQAAPLAAGLVDAERRVLGEEHPNTLTGMYEFAILSYRDGKYPQAEQLVTRALAVERRKLGEESVPTLQMMQTLGVLYVDEGKYADAETTLRQVLAARTRVLGEGSPDVLMTMSVLAQLHKSRGEFAAAEQMMSTVRQARLRVLSPQHPQMFASNHDLGALYLAQGRYAQAEAMFREALAGRRRVIGDDHPDTLASLLGLVESYGDQGKYREAEPLAAEAVRRFQANRPENWRRYKAESLLGGVLTGQQRYAEAEPLLLTGYQGLAERQSTIPAADRPAIQQAADRVFQLYQRAGQPEKAAAWRAQLDPTARTRPHD